MLWKRAAGALKPLAVKMVVPQPGAAPPGLQLAVLKSFDCVFLLFPSHLLTVRRLCSFGTPRQVIATLLVREPQPLACVEGAAKEGNAGRFYHNFQGDARYRRCRSLHQYSHSISSHLASGESLSRNTPILRGRGDHDRVNGQTVWDFTRHGCWLLRHDAHAQPVLICAVCLVSVFW